MRARRAALLFRRGAGRRAHPRLPAPALGPAEVWAALCYLYALLLLLLCCWPALLAAPTGYCRSQGRPSPAPMAPTPRSPPAMLPSNTWTCSERCRKTELRLMALQAGDIRLRPQLLAACSEEVAVFCKAVEPGVWLAAAWAAAAQRAQAGEACGALRSRPRMPAWRFTKWRGKGCPQACCHAPASRPQARAACTSALQRAWASQASGGCPSLLRLAAALLADGTSAPAIRSPAWRDGWPTRSPPLRPACRAARSAARR